MEEKSEKSGVIQESNRDEKGRFKEGMSGNPAGKPIGARGFTTKVREALEKIADGQNYTYEEAFIKAILKKAIIDRDVGMMRTVWEQLDGKPIQRTELTGKDGEPIVIIDDIYGKIKSRANREDSGDTSDSD